MAEPLPICRLLIVPTVSWVHGYCSSASSRFEMIHTSRPKQLLRHQSWEGTVCRPQRTGLVRGGEGRCLAPLAIARSLPYASPRRYGRMCGVPTLQVGLPAIVLGIV